MLNFRISTIGAAAVSAACGLAQAATTQVYFNDFETAIGASMSLTGGGGVLGLDFDSAPASSFLGLADGISNGGLDNNHVTLSLAGLDSHSVLTVVFDVYIMRSMDGGFNCCGPDLFQFALGGFVRTTTFGGPTQAFPNYIETGGSPSDNAPYTDGTFTGSAQGAFFPVSFTIPHTASTVAMSFSMSGLQGVFDEGWGLDNVRVSIDAPAIPEPASIPLIIAGLAAAGLSTLRRVRTAA